MTDQTETGLISDDMAQRLIMVSPKEFQKLVKDGWITPETRNPVRFRLVAVVQGHIRALEHERTRGRSVAELAQHLGLSVKRVNELLDNGTIERQARADYDLDTCRLAYLAKLRATAQGRGAGGEGDASLSAARTRFMVAKAEEAEARARQTSSGWAPILDLKVAMTRSMTALRELLLSSPGQLAHRLVGLSRAEIHHELDRHMRAVLNSIADGHIARAVEKAAHEG
ncbi:hypothetical protein AS156_30895 [Bradyrhizobium macuxiense]|uniref:Uncharacterized protein n=2 Tax=Bradyrhizobium macuxiense TaxID=1755647 RepID=A0A109K2R3_9BRAD|nr:hypothetical protein AS156_30895 [Bradyrhizobium macuxiense]